MRNIGLKSIVRYIRGQGIRILLYHNILNDCNDPYAVNIENFKAQMDWISNNGYDVISLNKAMELLDNGESCKKHIVLTFDDGFMDFLQNALPVLDKYGFKVTVFVVVSEAGGISSWRTRDLNRRLMGWDDLKKIIDQGHSIGNHGLHHLDLTKITQEDLNKEIVLSRDIIQERSGIKANSFSYPWGICGDREIDDVKKAGYRCAVSTASRWHNGPDTNRFLLERISMEQHDTISTFAKKLR